MEVSGQLHTSAALPPGNSSWYPLDKRLDGPQGLSRHCGKEKSPCPCQKSKPGHSVHSLVTTLTELS